MRAIQIKQHLDGLNGLSECLTDLPDPKPTGNQVLIEVKCVGMNFYDILQVQGKYQDQPPLPFIPGGEFSGVISKNSPIPKGCPFIPGQTRVFGSQQGSYSTKIATRWDQLIEIPTALSFEEAAAIYITYATSYASLVNSGNLKKGEWCLIHAAAGGVGIAAVQIAKALGAKVIATASTQEKLEFVRKYGGLSDQDDLTLVYNDLPASTSPVGNKKAGKLLAWQAEVLKITKGKGVDVVLDPVGMLMKSLKVSAFNARIVIVGFAGGQIEKVPANVLLLKNVSLMGLFWVSDFILPKNLDVVKRFIAIDFFKLSLQGGCAKSDPPRVHQVWAALLELIDRGQVRPVLHPKIYDGLARLPEGLADLANRKVLGKAILRVENVPQSKL